VPDELCCFERRETSSVMPKKPSRHGRGTSRTGGAFRRPDRKTLQLCEQVRHTLEYVLTGELDDDVLRMLYVARVEPAPDADRLLVTVVPLTKDAQSDPVQITTRLHAHAPTLRAAVASAISRRKVPDLMYRFVDSDPDEGGGVARTADASEEE
jgi:ribosome-binding factor A